MHRNPNNVSTKRQRIMELARQSPRMGFTSLAYLMDIDWLKEAYRRTRKDGAVGVDGMNADDYEQDLEGNCTYPRHVADCPPSAVPFATNWLSVEDPSSWKPHP